MYSSHFNLVSLLSVVFTLYPGEEQALKTSPSIYRIFRRPKYRIFLKKIKKIFSIPILRIDVLSQGLLIVTLLAEAL